MSLLGLLASSTEGTPVEPDVPVTATAPTADDTANTITIPTVTGVVYQVDGSTVTGTLDIGDVATTITVNAVASAGYVLTGTTSWTFTFTGAAVLTPLYPGATPEAVPAPLAEWDFREASAPFYTTTATGGDLPLQVMSATSPVPLEHELGRALHMYGDQWLAVPQADIGRLNMGATGKTQVSMAVWFYNARPEQVCVAGIWGETFDPPTRQYALFGDLPAFGGDNMACFHISKDGGPTPGFIYSGDYSANPDTMTLGRWELHVGTYDGTEMVSYLNGTAYAYTSWAGGTREGDGLRNPYTFFDGLNSQPEDFHVGAIADGTSNVYGMIRRLRVWDTALTPGQVLTLAAEHSPLDVPDLDPGIDYALTDQQHITSAEKGGNFLSHTWTVDAGAEAADRVVLLALAFRGQYSSMPTLTGVTINGAPATLLQNNGQDGGVFAYATVPTGTTVTVGASWSGTATALANLTVLRLTGVQATHSGFVRNASRKQVGAPASARGGLVIGFARVNNGNINAQWSPVADRITNPAGNDDDPYGVTTAATIATGYVVPFVCNQGTAPPGWLAAVSFDPA